MSPPAADQPGPDHRRPPGAGHPGARELLGALVRRRSRRTSTSTSRCSGWATSCSRSARASSGRTRRATSRRAPTWQGNQYLRLRLGAQCTPTATAPRGGARWLRHRHLELPDPATTRPDLPTLTDEKFQRMKAQVNNAATAGTSSRTRPRPNPNRPTRADQGQLHPRRDAALRRPATSSPSPIAMANDYNGYIATYREYQRGDHYRKALTAWGPHSSDYLATRLVHARPAPEGTRRAAARRPAAGGELADADGESRPTSRSTTTRAKALGTTRRTRRRRLRGRAARRRRRGRGRRPARRRRALRRGLLHLERRLELHRQPRRARAAQGRRRLAGRTPTSPASSR